jgi:hypothetical protein
MSTIAAAIIQQRTPRPMQPQTTKAELELGEAVEPSLVAVNPSIMKASSAMKATMKEIRPVTKSTFATASQLYHGCIAASKAGVEAGSHQPCPLT